MKLLSRISAPLSILLCTLLLPLLIYKSGWWLRHECAALFNAPDCSTEDVFPVYEEPYIKAPPLDIMAFVRVEEKIDAFVLRIENR